MHRYTEPQNALCDPPERYRDTYIFCALYLSRKIQNGICDPPERYRTTVGRSYYIRRT